MDYQKAYKEALAHAREIHRNEEEKRRDMEFIFPELKESEDEKIRKKLITFFQRFPYERIDDAGTNVKEAIAWLEKQAIPQMVEDAFLKGCNDTKKCLLKRQSERKSAWNEEDEKIFVNLTSYGSLKYTGEQVIEWLNSLKQRIKKEAV